MSLSSFGIYNQWIRYGQIQKFPFLPNSYFLGIHRERMDCSYLFADFDDNPNRRFSNTYELLRTLLSDRGVSTVTKNFVSPRPPSSSSWAVE